MKEISYVHNDWGYYTIFNKFVEKYPTYPSWLFKELGALVDHQVDLQNDIALDIFNPSTRESAYAFAQRCGYDPVEKSPSTATIVATLTAPMAKTIPVGYQFGGTNEETGKYLYFENTIAASSGGTAAVTCYCEQKRTYTDVKIGDLGIVIEYQEIQIKGYSGIIKASISLSIDSSVWTRVDNFDESISTDRHFILYYQSAGKTFILFGDGTNGAMPSNNKTVYATFAVTEGLLGAIDAACIKDNIGADSDIQSLTNASGSVGGSDEESVAAVVRNSKASLRMKNIIWTQEDLETAARAASSSVVKSLGITGYGEAGIIIVPSGGGAPSAGLKTTVDTYVTERTQFGLMPITVSDPTYSTEDITATITVLAGFVSATVQDLVEFALTLASCAYDNQVTEYFQTNGVDATRINIINSLWSWAFTEYENDALDFIINKWISLLGNRDYREFNQALEIGDLWIMGNSLIDYGVDEFELVSPTSNQIPGADEIIDSGTITVTVI